MQFGLPGITERQAPTAQSTYTASTTVVPSQPVHSAYPSTASRMDGHYLDSVSAITVSPYFGQPTFATQPLHPSGTFSTADTLSLHMHRQSSTATAAMTLPTGIQPQPLTVHVDTPTCTQRLHLFGLSTAGASAITTVNIQFTLVPTTHDLVE